MRISRTLKTTLAVGATTSLMMLGLGSASAHVSATPTETAAGAYSLVTFSVGHGCEGSPTTAVTITLPDELNDATPTVNPNWTITTAQQKLETPRTLANGSKISERTESITYTAKTPLADHQRDTFTLSVQLPETAGTTLHFPTLQTCETGQTDWKEIPAAGADHDSVKAPAPELTVTAAVAQDAHDGHDAAASVASSASASDAGTTWPAWLGLGAGLAGLILGGLAFWRTSRKA
ncbi:YcnI family protein [Arthrobacter glacialis]|uniref:Nuclear export factor GLE1 n=1 Tax=Arthrobacter glacialis TaxID=1664 RepID=A0A2S4A1J1_ARTGL|nr:YcnI family protein [Arthrobacter glacialis]POH61216.1 nuclear export factor GLE1 [Arthrobacter glacialis]POH75353.1 nuclear export factor GLE1 [Arthrobacter glacialis]